MSSLGGLLWRYNGGMRKLVKQQAVVWLALLGVLFGTLAPTLSHAMAPGQPATFEMQICSGAGMTTVTIQLGASDAAPAHDGANHVFEHCPYCGQNANMPFLPPAALAAIPAPVLAAGYPARFYQSATPLFPWTASSPRAPPVLI